VETIDDHIKGTVVASDGELLSIEDSDGFILSFPTSSLMFQTPEDLGRQVSSEAVEEAKRKKGSPSRKTISKSHLRNADRSFTVDLHIDKLVDSTRGMSNFDMLNLQLETARRQLEFAIQKKMLKMVFIHGVGEGVLKMELHTLLRRYDIIQFYDADYRTYGIGATEVRIFQTG
jgi:hypothetical protein